MSTATAHSQQQSNPPQQKEPIFVMQTMQSPSERYLSTESLENDRNSTTSSTESPGGIPHRKDHEFIPTRLKTITASRPAADPRQFTKIPSNPLLISAQKQLMQAEEVRKLKEAEKPLRRQEEEPDWQSELNSWKNRRRKQSEDCVQTVAQIKAMEDAEMSGGQRKLSLAKKFSSLLYTGGEDDWSDLGFDPPSPPSSVSMDAKNKRSISASVLETRSIFQNNRKPSTEEMADSSSPPQTINEDEEDSGVPSSPVNKIQPEEHKDDVKAKQPVKNEITKRAISTPLIHYSQSSMTSGVADPQVRRKSSELSMTMKSRLEAFKAESGASEVQKTIVEPDGAFREKLQTFRKMSEGRVEKGEERKPRPPQSISSLLSGSDFISTLNNSGDNRNNEESENDTLEDVDQLLDDALEESYRSILEDPPNSHQSSMEDSHRRSSNGILTDDIISASSSKAPPTEKPPPPPPNPEIEDAEVDAQEQEIIASLQMEEREHKKYMETTERLKKMPTPSTGNFQQEKGLVAKPSMSSGSNQMVPMAPPVMEGKNSEPAQVKGVAINNATEPNHSQAQKKQQSPDSQQQRSYNQHWLVQEAEKRRIADMQNRPQQQSVRPRQQPAAPSSQLQHQDSMITQALRQQQQHHHRPHHAMGNSPVYENSYVNFNANHTRLAPQHSLGNSYSPPQINQFPMPNENVYANLSNQPPLGPNFHQNQSSYLGDDMIPGPQVPPRNPGDSSASETGDRVLSVSGKKRCSHCKEELGRGAAMIIESLRLFYHLRCFQCCVCQIQLGNGATGTDVRVRNNKLHCQNCYSNDDGLKFSKV